MEPKQNGLADVVIGAIGLSGVLFLIAILLAVVVAGVLFFLRSRDPLSNATEGYARAVTSLLFRNRRSARE